MKIQQISGKGVPVVGNDIDTDRIIPARFLRCVTFDGLGEQAFADDRSQEAGRHPFDQPQYQGANILVVNGNFGCGSSREHAPQALSKWGIQAIIGESFAEIFFGNCVAIGVPCVTAEAQVVQHIQTLLEHEPQMALSLDLDTMQVNYGDFDAAVSLGTGPRQMLLSGTWDNCRQLINDPEAIAKTAAKLPYLSWSR